MSHSNKSEFVADLFINVLTQEPDVPLYMGFCVSEVNNENKEPEVKTYEVADPAYSRQRVEFTPIDKQFVYLKYNLDFPKASQKWVKVTHFAIWDDLRGGNLLLLKPTGGVANVEVGEAVVIMASEFQLYVGQNSTTLGEFDG